MSFRKPRNGFALIAVLWVLSLLTLLATAAAVLASSHRRLVQGYAASVQTDLILESAFRIMLLELMQPYRPGHGWRSGQTIQLAVLGSSAQVTLLRESGRIDLNAADEDLLFALFCADGWDEDAARALSRRIRDWRVSDNGSGASEGGAKGYNVRHAPFESVDELRQVSGAERVSKELMDTFTVYSHLRIPDARAAPPPVMRALEWADRHMLGDHRWIETSGSALVGRPEDEFEPIGELLRIRTCTSQQRSRRCVDGVVRLTGNTYKPAQVFDWTWLSQ